MGRCPKKASTSSEICAAAVKFKLLIECGVHLYFSQRKGENHVTDHKSLCYSKPPLPPSSPRALCSLLHLSHVFNLLLWTGTNRIRRQKSKWLQSPECFSPSGLNGDVTQSSPFPSSPHIVSITTILRSHFKPVGKVHVFSSFKPPQGVRENKQSLRQHTLKNYRHQHTSISCLTTFMIVNSSICFISCTSWEVFSSSSIFILQV